MGELKKNTEGVAEKTSKNLYDKEEYEITLPMSDNMPPHVNVIVNGDAYQIMRGEPVKVPAAVYEVLKNSEKMDNLAMKRSKALADKNQ